MKKLIAYILVIIAIMGCETDAIINLDTKSETVVTAFIYKDSTVWINAYGTVSYTDTMKYNPLNGLNVTMTVNPPSDGYYTSIGDGKITTRLDNVEMNYGDSVVIEIYNKDNDETATGGTRILEPVKIKNINYTEYILNQKDTVIDLSLSLDDPAATDDYYQIVARAKETAENGEQRITPLECEYNDYIFYAANSSLTTTSQSSSSSIGLFNDKLFNGKSRHASFRIKKDNIKNAIKNNTSKLIVEVLLYHHTYDYYNYCYTSRLAQSYIILPVFGITSIHSNIDNGVGIVTGMSFDKMEVEIAR